jgi:hypothetical protein
MKKKAIKIVGIGAVAFLMLITILPACSASLCSTLPKRENGHYEEVLVPFYVERDKEGNPVLTLYYIKLVWVWDYPEYPINLP